MDNWTEAGTAPPEEKPGIDVGKRIIALRQRIARDAAVVRNLETNWIPELEKELAELQQVDLAKHPQPARIGGTSDTVELNTSVAMVVLNDLGDEELGHVIAGAVITTRDGEALEELRRLNPNRKVFRVSLEALNERKAAGHAK